MQIVLGRQAKSLPIGFGNENATSTGDVETAMNSCTHTSGASVAHFARANNYTRDTDAVYNDNVVRSRDRMRAP